MKENLKNYWNKSKEMVKGGLETARTTGLPRKIITITLGATACMIAIFLFLRAVGYLFDIIYAFVNKYFLGLCATAAGGSCIALEHYKRKEKQKQEEDEFGKRCDAQKERFCKGCYQTIGSFLFSSVGSVK